jgi:enolase
MKMKVKKLRARVIKDTRNEDTIEISLVTKFGNFVASSPNGKSTGEHEVRSWKGKVYDDVETVNEFFIGDVNLRNFGDLKLIENIFGDKVGGNTVIALQYVFLKALAKEMGREVWEVINSRAKKMPFPVGNVIGGGKHSSGKRADFQEFHLIPMCDIEKAVEINKRAFVEIKRILKNVDKGFKGEVNDENAWQSSLGNDAVIEVMKNVRDNMIDEFKVRIHLGIDVAGSSFYDDGKYIYKNPKSVRVKSEQVRYMNEIAKSVFYLEDPLEENDFRGFSKLQSKGLIVGDDLTTTSLERLKIAHLKGSVNAIIIKPNQIGSLIEVSEIVKYCKKNKIKMIFSHRSGETRDSILADICFGFGGNFIKTGVLSVGRKEKLNRLIEIEKGL